GSPSLRRQACSRRSSTSPCSSAPTGWPGRPARPRCFNNKTGKEASTVANATKAAHQRPHRMKVKMTVSDYVIVILMDVIMLVVFVATLYPFFNSFAISLNYADHTMLGGITISPRKFTLDNYKNIFTKE